MSQLRFQVQNLGNAGILNDAEGNEVQRISVNLQEVGTGGVMGGTNFNLNLTADEAADYFPGQIYTVSLVLEDAAPASPDLIPEV